MRYIRACFITFAWYAFPDVAGELGTAGRGCLQSNGLNAAGANSRCQHSVESTRTGWKHRVAPHAPVPRDIGKQLDRADFKNRTEIAGRGNDKAYA